MTTDPRLAPPEPATRALAVYLARRIFEAPYMPQGDQVQRIAFRGGNYASGHETDLGGMCEEALVGVLEDALRAYGSDAADEIERLCVKLRRINAINDSPATFNREIDRLTSCSNFIAPDEYCEKVIGHEGACGYEPAPTAAVATGTERFNVPGVLRMLEAEAAAPFSPRTQQQEEIERLQHALSFWLHGVPADDPEIAQRAGDDAGLLAGYDGDEPSAEERGWIRLREAP